MRLSFKQKYLSIDQFDPVEISDFVVLTGVNGSGKSHLLDALEKRHVAIEGMENAHVVLFNYETFKLENEQLFNAQQLSTERDNTWQHLQQAVVPSLHNWRAGLGDDYVQLKVSLVNEKTSLWDSAAAQVSVYKNYTKAYFERPDIKLNQQAQGLYSLAKSLPYGIDEITREDFDRKFKPYIFKSDFLPNQLGRVFWDYYGKLFRNQIAEFQNEKHGKSENVLTEAQFVSTHGRPPWDVVNEVLERFDTLDYRVASPEGDDYFGSYQLKLKHTKIQGLKVDFGHLSSGERILMALVASVYKSSSDKHFPDLLLLDEVDASLHPSMMKNMLDVIQSVFLKRGVKVILITHSPTTLALAPEEAIFVMNRSGTTRIEKKSKAVALSILTQGFATLEQGLTLVDQIAKVELTILTEGHNVSIIRKVLELNGISDVDVLAGIEGMTGQSQLKTIFSFLTKMQHKNKVLFVLDCDVKFGLPSENNTFPFVLPINVQNDITNKGIENAFPKHLLSDFTKTITRSNAPTIVEFDDARKRDFMEYVLQRNDKSDFLHFDSLIEEIMRIKAIKVV